MYLEEFPHPPPSSLLNFYGVHTSAIGKGFKPFKLFNRTYGLTAKIKALRLLEPPARYAVSAAMPVRALLYGRNDVITLSTVYILALLMDTKLNL